MSSYVGLTPNNPLKYLGPNVSLSTVCVRNRAPTSADVFQPETGKLYPIGSFWSVSKNPTTGTFGDLWALSKIEANVATWDQIANSTPVTNEFPITPYVVGPAGQAGYQTIQSALDAANSAGGGSVYVQPGTYTENLNLYDNTQVVGAVGFADIGDLVIIGVHVPPSTGGFVFRNVTLQSATHIFNSSVAGSAHLIIGDAAIIVTNGYTFNLPNWTGKLECFDVNDRGSTNDGFVNNTGGSEVAIFSSAIGAGSGNTMIVRGITSIFTCDVGCPINFQTGSNAFLEGNVHTNTLTFSNNSTGEIVYSEIDATIVMNSSGSWLISETTINTATNPSISGAGSGTLTIGSVTFVNNSSISSSLTLSTAPTLVATQGTYYGDVSVLQTLTNSSTTRKVLVSNSDTSNAGANAQVIMETGGASSGNPQTIWSVSGATDWSVGIDNSASDAWVLSRSATLGTNNALSVSTSNAVTFNSAYTLPTVDGTADQVLTTDGSGVVTWQSNAGASTPAFSAYVTNDTPSVTGEGQAYTVINYTEDFDVQANFDPTTGTFTAPYDLTMQFNMYITFYLIGGTAGDRGYLQLQTTSKNYDFYILPQVTTALKGSCAFSQLVSMSTGDTAKMVFSISGAAATFTGVHGTTDPDATRFSGFIVSRT